MLAPFYVSSWIPYNADEQNNPASGKASQADTSAVAAINDSVGKFGIDQLNRAIDDGKRCVEQAEQAKAFPGHGVSCQETQRLCLYCAQKLVLHHWLVPLSLCPVVRTKFPNRVMYRVPRGGVRANARLSPSYHPSLPRG